MSPDGMSNVLSRTKQQQVVALSQLGWSARRIEAETGIRRETASKYIKAAGVAMRPPGRWGRSPPSILPVGDPAKAANEVITGSEGLTAKAAIEVITDFCGQDSKPANEVITDPGDDPADVVVEESGPARKPTSSLCEPFLEFIEEGLRKKRNAMSIWQELVTDHGFKARYASVGRFVRKLLGSTRPDARAVIQTPPGEEAQVDYGEGPLVRNPTTGKYRKPRLFVLTLGFSRKSVRLLTWTSSTRIWCELHEKAFRRLGGSLRVVVLDNLKEGVLKADIYDPELNPLYRDLLKHYGAVALPCRAGDPDRKGKVESGVGHAQRTPLKGKRFESLEDAQSYLDAWETRWADTRIHGTTKRQVAAMFAQEKPVLRPLPIEPFRYYEHGNRSVHLDGCVEVQGAYYAAPPGFIGQRLNVQWDGRVVRILDPKTGLLLREREKQAPGTYCIHPEDKPKKTPVGTLKLIARSRCIGVNVGTLCEQIYHHDGQTGVKRILGILSLGRKHGAHILDDACALALDMNIPTYRFVSNYLGRKPRHPPLSLKQVDPMIRQLTEYRDLVAQLAAKPQPGE